MFKGFKGLTGSGATDFQNGGEAGVTKSVSDLTAYISTRDPRGDSEKGGHQEPGQATSPDLGDGGGAPRQDGGGEAA